MTGALGAVLAGREPVTWVFAGDSITQGLFHTGGRRSYVEHFHERVRGELDRVADHVVNTGTNGSCCPDLLAAFDDRVARFAPTVVSVLLGTNDATAGVGGRAAFRAQLVEIVATVREIGAIPLVHTPPWIDVAGAESRADLAAYADLAREATEEHDVDLVDHHDHWLAADPATRLSWLADPFHPNARGHLEMAKVLFRQLGIFDAASATCSLDLS